MLNKIIIIASFFIFSTSCAQDDGIGKEDLKIRSNVDSLIHIKFQKFVGNSNYAVFSIINQNSYLILVENERNYKEYYFDKKENNVNLGMTYQKPNKLFNKLFDLKSYDRKFTTFYSKFYQEKDDYLARGNSTYFVVKDSIGNRYGEMRLSVFVQPIPIEAEVYLYLVNRIIHYMKDK